MNPQQIVVLKQRSKRNDLNNVQFQDRIMYNQKSALNLEKMISKFQQLRGRWSEMMKSKNSLSLSQETIKIEQNEFGFTLLKMLLSLAHVQENQKADPSFISPEIILQEFQSTVKSLEKVLRFNQRMTRLENEISTLQEQQNVKCVNNFVENDNDCIKEEQHYEARKTQRQIITSQNQVRHDSIDQEKNETYPFLQPHESYENYCRMMRARIQGQGMMPISNPVLGNYQLPYYNTNPPPWHPLHNFYESFGSNQIDPWSPYFADQYRQFMIREQFQQPDFNAKSQQ